MSLNILIISQLQGLNPSPVPKHSRLYHLWLFRKGYREGHALLGCSAKGRSHPTEEGPQQGWRRGFRPPKPCILLRDFMFPHCLTHQNFEIYWDFW